METDTTTGARFQESLLEVKSLEKSEKFYCGVTSKDSTADYETSVEAYCKYSRENLFCAFVARLKIVFNRIKLGLVL